MGAGRHGRRRKTQPMNMAFLSSFRVGSETVYPESLRTQLRSFSLLSEVGDSGLKRLLGEANWFCLPGGMLLQRDGENSRALFLVVTGSLGVFVEDERGNRKLVAHIPAGETVGEMSLISGEAHSANSWRCATANSCASVPKPSMV